MFIGINEDSYFHVVSYDPTRDPDEAYGVRIIGDGQIKYGNEADIILNSLLIEEPR